MKIQYGTDMKAPMNKYIASCGKTDLCKLLIEMALIRNIERRGEKDDPLLSMAGRYKVNVKSIEKQIKEGKKEKKAKLSTKKDEKLQPGVCRECGCTEEKPCKAGCSWTDKTKTLCTACQMAKEHSWEKQNLVTVASTPKVPMHDIYKCKKCGATAKRFGVGPIRRDKKFIKLEECPGRPKAKVQTSAKKK